MVSSISPAAFLAMCALNSKLSIGILVDAIGIVFGHSALVIEAFIHPARKMHQIVRH